mmetsp:Transcript_41119/g.63335  ORF Transcript_41119/g.63335 Transcript_41119/m.63335 type:complete len:397 (-) Transcript_41119:34-1224(-)
MKFTISSAFLAALSLPTLVLGSGGKGGKGGKSADEDCTCRGQVSFELVRAPKAMPCMVQKKKRRERLPRGMGDDILIEAVLVEDTEEEAGDPAEEPPVRKLNKNEGETYDNKDEQDDRKLDWSGPKGLSVAAWQDYLNEDPEFEGCVLAPVTSKDDLEFYYRLLRKPGESAALGVFKDIREAQECRRENEQGNGDDIFDGCFDDWKNIDAGAGGVPSDDDLWAGPPTGRFDLGQPDGFSMLGGGGERGLATVGILGGNLETGPVLFDESAFDSSWEYAIVKCCDNAYTKCLNDEEDEMMGMMKPWMMMKHGGGRDGWGDNGNCEQDEQRVTEPTNRGRRGLGGNDEHRQLDSDGDCRPEFPKMWPVLHQGQVTWEMIPHRDAMPKCERPPTPAPSP